MKLPITFRTCLIGMAILVLLSISCLFLFPSIVWSGHGDLTIEFIVVDSSSDQPVANAELKIFLLDRPPMPEGEFLIALQTDQKGTTVRTERVMTSGRANDFPFAVDTYYASVPNWRCRVAAPGFETTEIANIHDFCGETKHIEPAKYHLTIPVRLRKSS